jgi:hypothetical protein
MLGDTFRGHGRSAETHRKGATVSDRTVYFAKITREPRLFDRTFADDIVEALDPLSTVGRYRRDWRFSRPVVLDGGYIAGKLGFVRSHPAAELTYDEERLDFVEREGVATEGSFSMFVIDTQREIIAFEERPPDIELQSFLGALKKLFTAADFAASIELLSDPRAFGEWARTVERITRVRVVVHPPNPGWNEDAGALREIVEQSHAERAEVVAVAPADGSIDPSAQWIDGALVHIAEHGQGKVSAIGVNGERRDRWQSGERLQTATIREADAASPQGVWDWIREKLRELYGG